MDINKRTQKSVYRNQQTYNRQALKVAKMFYEKKQSQTKMAKMENISQAKVSRLLKHANEAGWVSTRVLVPTQLSLENALLNRFKMRECRVVYSLYSGNEQNETNTTLATTAAEYLESKLWDGCSIALTCGMTLMYTIAQLEGYKFKNLNIFSLNNYISNKNLGLLSLMDASSLATIFYSKYKQPDDDTSVFIQSPFYQMDSQLDAIEKERKKIQRIPDVSEMLKNLEEVDIVVSGIGAFHDKSTSSNVQNLLKEFNIDIKAVSQKAKGEISLLPYSEKGFLVDDYRELFLKTTLLEPPILENILKRNRKKGRVSSIAIAAGLEKAEAIKIALELNFFDALVTDDKTASEILNLS